MPLNQKHKITDIAAFLFILIVLGFYILLAISRNTAMGRDIIETTLTKTASWKVMAAAH
ncbi:MAG: hypothetical protein ACJAYG_000155 [Oceanicoccus sp.]|jgi:hypothetical protein